MTDTILIYKSTWELIRELPDAEQLKVITALCKKWFEDIEPDLNGLTGAVYNQANLLTEKAKNRYAAAVENGKKGGAPKGSRNNPNGRKGTGTNQKTNQLTNQTSNQKTNQLTNPNVNVNVNDNEKDNVNDNETVNDLFTPDGVIIKDRDTDDFTSSMIDEVETNIPITSTLVKEEKKDDYCLGGGSAVPPTAPQTAEDVIASIKTPALREQVLKWWNYCGANAGISPAQLRDKLKQLHKDCNGNVDDMIETVTRCALNNWREFKIYTYDTQSKSKKKNKFDAKPTPPPPTSNTPWMSYEEKQKRQEELDKWADAEVAKILAKYE